MKKLLISTTLTLSLLLAGTVSAEGNTHLEIQTIDSEVTSVQAGAGLRLRVALLDGEGAATSTESGIDFVLSDDGEGEFANGSESDSDCPSSGEWGTGPNRINATQNSRAFCYRNSTPGSYVVTVSAEGFSSASFDVVVTQIPSVTIMDGEGVESEPYSTIEDAVGDATAGDTVLVYGGTYNISSAIAVEEDITIKAADSESPLVISTVDGYQGAFQLDADGASLEGLEIRTASTLTNPVAVLVRADNVTVRDLVIDQQADSFNSALQIVGARSGVQLIDNMLTGGAIGLGQATDSTISGNSVSEVKAEGIFSAYGEGQSLTLENNEVTDYGTDSQAIMFVTEPASINGATESREAKATALMNSNEVAGVKIAGSEYGDVQISGGLYYPTIQEAIDASGENDTINVFEGTYEGFSVVGKSGLTIIGAGESSTIIRPSTLINTGIAHKYTSDMTASVLVDDSVDITISNLTVESNTSTPGSGGPDAIVFWNASSGSLESCAITGTYVINGVQTGQGIAVDASGSENTNLTVEGCDISGFQKNAIDVVNGNGSTSGATGTVNVDVVGGSLEGAGDTNAIAQNGLSLWNRGGGTVTGSIDGAVISGFNYTPDGASASGALAYGGGNLTTVSMTKFFDNELSLSVAEGSPVIDASNNWWGTPTPDFDTIVSENVTTDPWFLDENMTLSSNEATVVDETGTATLGGDIDQVVVTSSDDTITVESGSAEGSLVLSSLLEDGEAEVPEITVNSDTVDVFIPETTITSEDEDWDGVLTLPRVTTAPAIEVGAEYAATAVLSIEVGAGDTALNFDDPVKLTFPGQAGNFVGWSRGGVFAEINTTCDSQTDPDLDSGEECKIDVGDDLVVWTTHFTTFVTFTQTSTDSGSDRASSGGGSSGSVASATVSASTPVGEVLGSFTEAERQAQIAAIRTQLASLISQLITMLQAQLAAAQAN